MDSSHLPSYLLKQQQECGYIDSWFMELGDCLQYEDPNAVPLVEGGCQYDMFGILLLILYFNPLCDRPVGDCKEEDVTDTSLGCAYAFENDFNGSAQSDGNAVWSPPTIQSEHSRFLVDHRHGDHTHPLLLLHLQPVLEAEIHRCSIFFLFSSLTPPFHTGLPRTP